MWRDSGWRVVLGRKNWGRTERKWRDGAGWGDGARVEFGGS